MRVLLSCALLSLAAFASSPLEDAPQKREIGDHTEGVRHLGLSRDGKVLFSAADDGSFHAWDLKKGETKWKQKTMGAVGFSVGEKLIAYNSGMAVVSLISAETGESRSGMGATTAMLPAKCLILTPGDTWAWIGTDKGVLSRVTLDDGNAWSNRPLQNGGVNCLAMDSKGKTIVVGGQDGSVRFVGAKSATTDKKKVIQTDKGPVRALAVDPQLKHVITGGKEGQLQVWSYKSGKLRHALKGHAADITKIAVDSKGKRIVSGDLAGKIRIWDLAKGSLLHELELGGTITSLLFIDKGKTLAASAAGSPKIALWNL